MANVRAAENSRNNGSIANPDQVNAIGRNVMGETARAFSSDHGENGAAVPSRRLLRRPTLAETERIARDCPHEALSVPVLVAAIRRETGCSRATAYRAVSDAFAADVLVRRASEGS